MASARDGRVGELAGKATGWKGMGEEGRGRQKKATLIGRKMKSSQVPSDWLSQ